MTARREKWTVKNPVLAALTTAQRLAFTPSGDTKVAVRRDIYLDTLCRAYLLAAADSPEKTELAALLEDACDKTGTDSTALQATESAWLRTWGFL